MRARDALYLDNTYINPTDSHSYNNPNPLTMFKPTIFTILLSYILCLIQPTMSNFASKGKISPLPQPTRYITTHNSTTEKAVVHSSEEAAWQSLDDDSMGFSVPFTTSKFPVDMNDEKDIREHEKLINSGKLGLVNPGGTVCRYVDFAPENKPIMHRTVSLDYGILLDGEIEMILDSGEKHVLKRGDIAVQRGTFHAWRNPSKTEWARMLFVLQSSENIVLNGKKLEEELPHDTEVQSSQ